MVVIMWFIKFMEIIFETSLYRMGIFPRATKGLVGIITSPLIHSDISHLFSNSFPLIVLSSGIIYFYPRVAFKVFMWVYFATGFWVWIAARDSYHIGASGLVYGFASFLFFSGIFRKNRQLMAISLLVIFLYGSLIWGIFPIDPKMSFETHLLAGVMGLIVAYYYRGSRIPKEIVQIDTYNSTLPQDNGQTWDITYTIVKEEKQGQVEKSRDSGFGRP